MHMQDRICVVTGAGSGLGLAMARGLLHAGARVAALDISAERLHQLTAEAPPSKCLTRVCDIRSEQDCASAIEQAITHFGAIHVLVNCAGLGMPHVRHDYLSNPVRFWEIEPQKWRDLIEVNINGAFMMSRSAAPHLLQQGWGRIINVTTSFSTMIRAANMPYGATKAALEAASHAWAQELEGSGVSVNVLIPGGAADTAMIPQDSPYDRSRLVEPSVMVAPVVWLASDQSNGISGQRIVARQWDASKPWQEALAKSASPIAWPDLANEALKGQPRSAGALKI
jgi:NAD(P)-dependent dehydrogenase (short-subunit alcohol dehydrogenase family)